MVNLVCTHEVYKLTRDKSHEYWHIKIGLKYKLNDVWSVKGGVRFRDSFDSIYEQSDITYKEGYLINLIRIIV